MPRQAHGLLLSGVGPPRPTKRKAVKSQYHNALQIAEKQNPTSMKVRQHRLGDIEEDEDIHPQSRGDGSERLHKRRKTTDDSEEDQNMEDSDGNQWHVGVEEDDEDSDIDSDEAFGESDEERFAGYSFRGTSANQAQGSSKFNKNVPAQRREIDLSERDASPNLSDDGFTEDEDDLGEDAIDLAAALDMNEEEERRAEETRMRRRKESSADRKKPSKDRESESGDEDSGESEDDDETSQLSFSGEDDEAGHSKLRRFLDDLQPSTADLQSTDARALGNGFSSSKLTAADLLQYVKDPRQRQSLKVLANIEKTEPKRYQGGIPGKLEPPLTKRQQDRLDRVAAYDKSKETLNRWVETVKQNRRAEHISFPVQNPAEVSNLGAINLTPTSQSRPINALEATIHEIMQDSGLISKNGPSADEQERAFEQLQEKNMPIEEIQARRAELRMARELMFREEIRARRIKKIKSKAYRRVHRKERDKAALEERAYLAASGLVDSDEERERNDRQRAEERMGARHRESRWAKSVKATGRVVWDEDARHGVSDLARRDEELRRRIEGKVVHGSDSDQDSTSGSDDGSNSAEDDGFQRFEEKIDRLEEDSLPVDTTRLGSMAFMRKAEATKKAANDTELRQLRGMVQGTLADVNEEAASVGRLRFGKQKETQIQPPRVPAGFGEFEEKLSGDEEDAETEQEVEKIIANGKDHNWLQRSSMTVERRQNTPLQQHSSNKVSALAVEAAVKPQAKTKKVALQKSAIEQTPDNPKSEDESQSEDDNQLDLNDNAAIAKALFAGDDIIGRDFEKEKKATILEEGDQVIDNTLPGWGSWAGAGISKREQKRAKGRFVTTIKGVAEEQRKDAKLERVIINEKRVKKNGKYLASELPHPFESRQQYERSLRLPIGPEWTTKSTFQDATKPRVLVKQGIIRPLTRPTA